MDNNNIFAAITGTADHHYTTPNRSSHSHSAIYYRRTMHTADCDALSQPVHIGRFSLGSRNGKVRDKLNRSTDKQRENR